MGQTQVEELDGRRCPTDGGFQPWADCRLRFAVLDFSPLCMNSVEALAESGGDLRQQFPQSHPKTESFPRKRESCRTGGPWIPAFAETTNQGLSSFVNLLEQTQ